MGLADQIARNRRNNRQKITVQSWGEDGGSAHIFATPVTAGDLDRLQRKHKDFLSNMTIAGMVDLIIMKAEVEDGSKAFTIEDRPVLMREEIGVIADIAGKMFADVQDIGQAEKN
ncbi:MAG: hypothetical protein VW496_01160 [Pelagibacteraceae bacterium]